VDTSDILILTNSPGELTTWVRPMVQQLRSQLGTDPVRLSIVFSPCPNATGREAEIARQYLGVDRVQAAEHFFPFLLWGQTAENWDWHDRGVVLFLGGDQFYTLVIGKRLGYRTVTYAEWDARWYRWIDRFGTMNATTATTIPKPYAHKVTIVGDLMTEVSIGQKTEDRGRRTENPSPSTPYPLPSTQDKGQRTKDEGQILTIGILPGSKAAKLQIGVPFMLAVASHIQRSRPDVRFVLPVAPTVNCAEIAQFADPARNPVIHQFGWATAELVQTDDRPLLRTSGEQGTIDVELHTEFPAYDLLAQCQVCLTTVGANTAELGSLASPMLMIIPTQQMDVMKMWDGLPGIIANLPLIGSGFATRFNWYMGYQLGVFGSGKRRTWFAWPNIWAGEEIVPELIGRLQPEAVAQQMLEWLDHPEKLQQMRDRLRGVRGEPGAASKLAALVIEELQGIEELQEMVQNQEDRS